MKRQKSIEGTYISNAIGYCHFDGHPGVLNRTQAYKHKCKGKKCKYLEMYNQKAFENQRYYNPRK